MISEDADPSGVETAGLISDLAVYFPTDSQWQQLRLYDTAQTLTLDRVYIPTAFGRIVAAHPTALRPGITAVTVTGVRHRTGSWYGTPTSLSEPVSFTLIMACSPTFPSCHILRLSRLNTPLK